MAAQHIELSDSEVIKHIHHDLRMPFDQKLRMVMRINEVKDPTEKEKELNHNHIKYLLHVDDDTIKYVDMNGDMFYLRNSDGKTNKTCLVSGLGLEQKTEKLYTAKHDLTLEENGKFSVYHKDKRLHASHRVVSLRNILYFIDGEHVVKKFKIHEDHDKNTVFDQILQLNYTTYCLF